MAGIEQALPCLLDRFTSPHSQQGEISRRSTAATLRNYQQSVLRDLAWLLNAKTCLDEEIAADFPEVGRSVLNYGTRDFCGVTASSLNLNEVEHELRVAIEIFEPRIVPNSLSIRVVPSPEKSGVNLVCFEIRAEVWAVPFPEQVFIKTELDLETGQYELK